MSGDTLTAQEARQNLYDVVRRDVPFEKKAQDALELGRQYLGVDNSHLTRIDQETGHWQAVVSTDSRDGQFPPGLELDLGTTYCRRTLAEGNQIVLNDAPEQGWEDDPAFENHGLHCYIGTPIFLDGDVFGTACFVSESPRSGEFSDGETMFAELITQLLERELESEQHEAELTRQTNLALVLNRVLRHNLRNDMAIIRGYTQLMADKLEEDTVSETALDRIDRLIALSEKARELDRVVGTEFKRESVEFVTLIEDIADTIREKYSSASITVDYDEPVTAAVYPSFERAVAELIENAAKHGGERPTVTVAIEATPNTVEIRIADDGPGLADHEADVLKTGTETPLTHGSGLGLWLSHWIISTHNGSVEATDTETGTTMTISIPRMYATNVTDQLDELERARDQYQAAFEEASDGMVIVNTDGRIIDSNSKANEIFGVDTQRLLGRSLTEFLRDDFEFEATWSEFESEERDCEQLTVVGDDGIERRVEYSATSDIVPGQHLIICRDITERTERERELRTTKQRFEAIFNNTVTFTGLLEPDGTLIEVNETALSLGGLESEDVLGKPIWETEWFRYSERTRETAREAVERAREGELFRDEVRVQAGGREAVIDFSIRPVTTDDGEVTLLLPEGRDITERKEYEDKLREEQELVRSIFQSLPDPFYAFDTDGNLTRWNDRLESVTGYSSSELDGMYVTELVPDDEAEVIARRFRQVLEERRSLTIESAIKTKDGTRHPYELAGGPLVDNDGNVTGVTGIGRDITERREREQQLEALNHAARRLMAAKTRSEVANIGVEEASEILGLKSNAIHLYEEDVDGLVPVAVTDAGREFIGEPPVLTEDNSIAWRAYETGEATTVTDVDGHPDAYDPETDVRSELYLPLRGEGVLISGSPKPDAFTQDTVTKGKLLAAAIGTAFEQVKREQRLRTREAELERQNERLEAFASIVSHDLRNPLQVAQGRLELAREEYDNEDLDAVERAHARMQTLIEDILTLAREGSAVSDRELVDLDELAEGCWATVETAAATLVTDTDKTVYADRSRLRQVLENLFRNAVEHGGEDVLVSVGALPDGFYVEDDGSGLPEGMDAESAFEAGYSTSENGTGFGLSIVKEIVEAHDWEIRVAEGTDGGARFEITGVEFSDRD